jgi:glycopeptide antibiotics resistance protein
MLEAGWVVVPATPLGLWIIVHGWRRRLDPLIVLLQLVALVHGAAVVAVAFFPFPYQSEIVESGRQFRLAHNNLFPLRSLIEALSTGAYPSVVDQSLGNLLMLMPVGVYLPLLLPRARRIGFTILIGLGLSLGVELGQLGVSALLGYAYKIADVDDVILNLSAWRWDSGSSGSLVIGCRIDGRILPNQSGITHSPEAQAPSVGDADACQLSYSCARVSIPAVLPTPKNAVALPDSSRKMTL